MIHALLTLLAFLTLTVTILLVDSSVLHVLHFDSASQNTDQLAACEANKAEYSCNYQQTTTMSNPNLANGRNAVTPYMRSSLARALYQKMMDDSKDREADHSYVRRDTMNDGNPLGVF